MHCRLVTQYAIIMVEFLAGLRKIKLLPGPVPMTLSYVVPVPIPVPRAVPMVSYPYPYPWSRTRTHTHTHGLVPVPMIGTHTTSLPYCSHCFEFIHEVNTEQTNNLEFITKTAAFINIYLVYCYIELIRG